ncbi:N-acetylmuramoyl-L-alanine amidase [Leptolyngbya valderiana BDU 20041]|nr:N-acetylmuramoyl-L-alanine amidase [Leptolyngbya valderiana BDU 20041]
MASESIQFRPLPYDQRLDSRALSEIELVVLHATELPDLAMARSYGERIHYPGSETGNSGHYYIDRDGRIEQWVSLDRVAHHVAGHNAHSIGIELVSLGRYPNWYDSRHQTWQESASDAQLDALVTLLQQLEEQLPNLRSIAGHDALDRRRVPASDNPDVEVARKLDPGPDFPWEQLLDSIGLKRLP